MTDHVRTLALKFFMSNDELRDYMGNSPKLASSEWRRSEVKIAVIDDEPFAPQANLQSYGYKFDVLGDIKSITEVESHHIVLCDLMGVGKHFDAKIQGASVIAEIKKKFPEKIVIAYTGAGLHEKASKQALARADDLLKKDIDIEEWTEALDKYAREALDPFVIWNKVRQRFVEMQVSTKTILHLEDSYVRSIKNRDSELVLLRRTANNVHIGPDVRAIVQGLISSLLFKAAFGS